MSLRDRLASVIRAGGPISVSSYMACCLHDPRDGYYATRPRLGGEGDFITAPHVSQMFGEILGLWAAEVWSRLGRPPRVRLVELGPGDGLMITDALRAARAAPGFLAACEVWLVETSPPLEALQRTALEDAPAPVRWAEALEALPLDAPVIVLANEFLDCQPIDQAVLTAGGWRERRIGLDEAGALAFVNGVFLSPSAHGEGQVAKPPGWGRVGQSPILGMIETAPPGASRHPPHEGEGGTGSVFEWSAGLAALGRQVGEVVQRATGAALFLDYGRGVPDLGDTLQAVRSHRKEGPLDNPGAADLTAHVDFPAFLDAARTAGARAGPIRTQRDFLRDLGIETRAGALAISHRDRAGAIDRQLARLIDADRMGELFKAACVWSGALTPPGFEVA